MDRLTTTMHDRIAQYGVTMTAVEVPERPSRDRWDGHEGARHYKVTLRRNGRRATVYYSMGPAHTHGPELANVMECLVLDAVSGNQTFAEFCAELGFDEDSRMAERTWKACGRIGEKLAQLFSYEEVHALTYETERG